ncbi:MAG TPA: Gfo/Idh/MocA family oxidoreductase [Bacteroidales bacterium]|jgi:hypothetical protein|nr:Gfo/Idh/MocA family oxidoreductase [Bacteroidales bacterium]
MKVGIAGSFSAINRHVCVLEKIKNVAISGCWTVNGQPDMATEHETGSQLKPEKIIEKSDALIITDPGNFYYDLATKALRNAKHVFIYTPVLRTVNDAFQLIKLGSEANVILKCGMTGKYGINGLIKNISDLKQINMIEFQHSIRISGGSWPDLSDILLGDMEIISRLIHARNTSVKAKGICMLSQKPEVINARLEFDNGTSVNYYCNTVSTRNDHFLTLVLKESILNYNLLNNELSGWHKNHSDVKDETPIFIENRRIEISDYLFDDLSAFFAIIQSGPAFLSIYDNGFESFVLTDRILEKVSKTLVQFA